MSAAAAASRALAPLLSVATPPLHALARRVLLAYFARLQRGSLAISEAGQPDVRLGAAAAEARSGDAHAVLRVRHARFWTRMLLGADLGFAEAYMTGDVECDELGEVFRLFIHNREALGNLQVGLLANASAWLQAQLNRRYANTRAGSLSNIGAHYDISNQMYEAFLSADMTYSCGVYPTLDADVGAARHASAKLARLSNGSPRAPKAQQADGEYAHDGPGGPTPPDAEARSDDGKLAKDELEAAQMTKLRLHIERADIRKGHRVLEIGTGWGSFAMEAVRRTGCVVESLTLSVEQKALAEARIAKAGMSDSIKVHLLDYRDMPASWNDSFDRVVSIEMLEAVGIEFLPTYFENVSRVLKVQGGAACFQCITMPESRFEAYAAGVDFIKKWIFPGGVLPSVTSLIDAATKGSKGTLLLDAALSIGPHYARTLREWRQRFDAAFDEHVRPALLSDHKAIRELPAEEQAREVEVFRKKWTYYFVYCEVGFTERVIGDHILSFTREGNTTLPTCCG